jgi:hypothetical protein
VTFLAVLVDAVALPEAEARAFWNRYSDWMQDHPGDLEGFARAEGLASVHPEMHRGRAVLVASHKGPQRPYGAAPKKR